MSKDAWVASTATGHLRVIRFGDRPIHIGLGTPIEVAMAVAAGIGAELPDMIGDLGPGPLSYRPIGADSPQGSLEVRG